VGKESTQGLFTLRVPDLSDTAGATGDLYLVRFYEAQLARLYPRRQGFAQIFQGPVENVEVHGHETY
jgi:hypothetical protein